MCKARAPRFTLAPSSSLTVDVVIGEVDVDALKPEQSLHRVDTE